MSIGRYKHEDYKSRYQSIVEENNVLRERMEKLSGCTDSVAATQRNLEQAELQLAQVMLTHL